MKLKYAQIGAIAICLTICLRMWAQTSTPVAPVTVTGNITDASGQPAQSGYVQFDIQPATSGIQYYVQGTTTIVPQTTQCGIVNGLLVQMTAGVPGAGACTVWGNDVISPSNTTYQVTFAPGGSPTNTVPQQCMYGATYNLNTPVFCPIVSIVPQYNTITTPNVAANIIPASNHVFTLGNAQAHYSAAYIDNLFLGTAGGNAPVNGNGYMMWNNNGAAAAALLIGYNPTYGPSPKLPDTYVTHPDFGQGMPIDWGTLSGNLACTSTPTITFSAPPVGVSLVPAQAKGLAECINSTVVLTAVFGGSGYDNTATGTVSGGGTSGALITPTFACTPKAADPTGNSDSTCAVQQAINWAVAGSPFNVALSNVPRPSVHIPSGSFSMVNVQVPVNVDVIGAGMPSTIILASDVFKSPMVRQPYQEGIGSLAPPNVPNNSGLGTAQGQFRDMTFSSRLLATQGQPADNNGGFMGTLLEDDSTYSRTENINFSNGARALQYSGSAEEPHAYNLYFGGVGTALPNTGQAGQVMIGLKVTAGGFTGAVGSGANYYRDANSYNGYSMSRTWNNATAISINNITTDGAGNFTVTILCTCVNLGYVNGQNSPVPPGGWFRLSNVTQSGYTWANGLFKATAVANVAGGFTLTSTYDSVNNPDAGIQSGGTIDYNPVGNPTLFGSTLQTPAVPGSGYVAGVGNFQISWFPPINNMMVLRGEGGIYEGIRCSSATQFICFVITGAGRVKVNSVYVESAATWPTLNSVFETGSYASQHGYISLTGGATFNNTNCVLKAPCQLQLQHPWPTLFTNYVSDPRHPWEQYVNAATYALMPPDYCPSCTGQPSVFPGLNRDQFEAVFAVPTIDGRVFIHTRNQGGGAPANYPWPNGTVFGFNRNWNPAISDNYPGTDVGDIHGNSQVIGTNPNNDFECNDAGPNVCASYYFGMRYDGHFLIPPPATGGTRLELPVYLHDVTEASNCTFQNGILELTGQYCIKAANGATIDVGPGVIPNSYGQATYGTTETASAASGTATRALTSGIIATQYQQPISMTVNSSGATVTRTGGQFTTGLVAGDPVSISGTPYTVLTVPNSVTLTVTPTPGSPYSGATLTANPWFVSNVRISDVGQHALAVVGDNVRGHGIFMSDVVTQASTTTIPYIPNSNPATFSGKQFVNQYAIADTAGISISAPVTSWTRSGSTFTLTSTNTFTNGWCVELSGFIAGSIINNTLPSGTPMGCSPISGATGSQFTVTYIGQIPPGFPTGPVSETTAVATYQRSSIMFYMNGGPQFLGVSACAGYGFTNGAALSTVTSAWRVCGNVGNTAYTITEAAATAHTFGQMPQFPSLAAHTWIGNPTASATTTPVISQIDAWSASVPSYILDTGAVNALVATLVPAVTANTAGLTVRVLPAFANTTTTPTLSVNGLSARTITKCGNIALSVADLTTTAIATFVLNGSPLNWQLQNPQANGCGAVNLLLGSLVTTAAASDNVSLTGMTASGHCSLTPTNAAASGATSVAYVSAKTTNQITVTHAVTASMNYDVMCTPN